MPSGKEENNMILTVTENQILMPKDIPVGTYKLVPVFSGDSKIRICELKKHFRFFDKSGKDSSVFTRIIYHLSKAGYTFIGELEQIDVNEFVKDTQIGNVSIAMLIVLCKECGVNILYDEKAYKKYIAKWEGRYERLMEC